MELTTFPIPKKTDRLVIAPIGDIQWTGATGSTAQDALKRHIDLCLEMGAFFIGMGDYIDFASTSNRRRLLAEDLYDTARAVIEQASFELVDEIFDKFLKPTKGRWIGLLEGHHFYQKDGATTDQYLAEILNTKFLGTSCFVRIPNADFVIYAHHGTGAGQLPGTGLNRLYHLAAGLQGADVYLMGHNTKVATAKLSRPLPIWEPKPKLKTQHIWLVNCGGFSQSNIPNHKQGSIPRGDYAEQGMMTPSPLSAPIVTVDLRKTHERTWVAI